MRLGSRFPPIKERAIEGGADGVFVGEGSTQSWPTWNPCQAVAGDIAVGPFATGSVSGAGPGSRTRERTRSAARHRRAHAMVKMREETIKASFGIAGRGSASLSPGAFQGFPCLPQGGLGVPQLLQQVIQILFPGRRGIGFV